MVGKPDRSASALPKAVEAEIDQAIRKALEVAAISPQKRTEAPIERWTLKRLVVWIREQFKIDCCRDTVRKVLKRLGFSWKKARNRSSIKPIPKSAVNTLKSSKA